MRKIALLLCCLLTGPAVAEETVASEVGQAVHKTNRAIGHATRDAAHEATGKDK